MRAHTLVDGTTVTDKDRIYIFWKDDFRKSDYGVNAYVEYDFELEKMGGKNFSQFYSTAESRDRALQEYNENNKSKTLKEIKDFIGDRNLIIADELLDFFKG